MALTDPPAAVSDAGPIIHLDELGSLNLLRDFKEVLIPRTVWNEIVIHRPGLLITDLPCASIMEMEDVPTPRLLAIASSLGLAWGETVALGMMESRQSHLFLCDDAAARLAAESLGLEVHGTIGIM